VALLVGACEEGDMELPAEKGDQSPSWADDAVLLLDRARRLDHGFNTVHFLKSIMTALSTRLKGEDFCHDLGIPSPEEMGDLLDKKKDVMAMKNGVIDFSLRRFFAKGHVPEDCVLSMSTNVRWVGGDDLQPKDDAQRAQMAEEKGRVMDKVFFKADVQLAARSAIGSTAYNSVVTKKVASLLGPRNGGKSLLATYLLNLLGD
jgi:hypothetical protein